MTTGFRRSFFFAALLLLCLQSAVLSIAASGQNSKNAYIARFAHERPGGWGMDLDGILTRVQTEEKVVALTLDACDGRREGYDSRLIEFLIGNKIPATLFVSSRWIDAHGETFAALAANPLFEIASHGTRHRPLSTTGRTAYGIRGTADIGEAFDEIEKNADKIEALTGRRPAFFRSGTAHYDDVAIRLLHALGYGVAGFAVNGDTGGTASAAAVEKALLSARSGDIVLCHMNRPRSGTASGLKRSIPLLLERGFRFVTLSELTAPKDIR